MEYNFKIIHKSGAQNVVADALSRIKIEDEKSDTNAMLAESLEGIFEKADLYPIQTRSMTKKNPDDSDGTKKGTTPQETLPYIEERNDFIINTDEFDHIFFIFTSETCDLRKKLEHKLNRRINICTRLSRFFL